MSRWFRRIFISSVLLGSCLSLSGRAQEPKPSAEESREDATPTTTLDPAIPPEQLTVLVKPLTKSELEIEAAAWMELLRQKARQIAAVRLGVQQTNEALSSEDHGVAEAAVGAAEAVIEEAEAEAEAAEGELTAQAQQEVGLQPSQAANAGERNDGSSEESAATAQTDDGTAISAADAKKQELLTKVSELQEERTAIADRLEIVLASLESKGGEVQEYRDYATAVSGIEIDATDASAAWATISGWFTSKEGGQRWGWNIVKFFAILLITYLVAKLVSGLVRWLLERKVQLSQLAEKLISRSIKDLILLIGFAIALTALEIDITPILAAIGAAGLVIGLALQGTLSNFASGLLILLNRPFDEGDVVNAGGVTGSVDKMNLVSTTFRTFDNQTIHVPNNEIWGNVITNITANENRRVDMEFGIGYDDDFEQAEQIIRDVVTDHELVLDDPEPTIVTHELADSCVKIVCRPWAKTSDWWTVKTDITRRVKKRFDEAGISIPFPQRDVHVYQHAPEIPAAAGMQADA